MDLDNRWLATWMDESVRSVKTMIKQVIVVVQKGIELVGKNHCFVFMVIEVNGNISLGVSDDLLVINSSKNRFSSCSQPLLTHTTVCVPERLSGGAKFLFLPLHSSITSHTILYFPHPCHSSVASK
jgi:hypothetical protein